MSQTKILVDTCSYLRLARNIHPLLAIAFGRAGYTLYAHDALTKEFSRQDRLENKFEWFKEQEYIENRSRPLQLGRKDAKEIANNYDYMWEHVKVENLKPSPVDVRILATAAALEIRMVTDDQDLLGLAQMYGVHADTSLEMMRLMLDENHINQDKVRQIVSQWIYDRDIPANFTTDYTRLFGEGLPEQ